MCLTSETVCRPRAGKETAQTTQWTRTSPAFDTETSATSPLSHENFVEVLEAWVKAGMPCR
jgi:hypothetical protein